MSRAADPQERKQNSNTVLLWFGVMAGPIAWSLHLLVSYALVQPACEHGLAFLLYLVSLATLAIATLGATIAWKHWRTTNETGGVSLRGIGGRPGFMAFFGLLASLFFLAGIILESVPLLFLGPCA